MKYKAVCFDVDGTFYPISIMNRHLMSVFAANPSVAFRYRAMRDTFRKLQKDDAGGSWQGLSFREREAICFGLAGGDGNARTLENGFYGPFASKYKTLKPCEGVVETLTALRNRGVKTGVFSDYPLFQKLEKMGIDGLIDLAYSCDDSGYLKPDGRAIGYLVDKIGVSPSQVLYVGDSYEKDVLGARAAGVDAVLVNCKDNGQYPKAVAVFADFESFGKWIISSTEDK